MVVNSTAVEGAGTSAPMPTGETTMTPAHKTGHLAWCALVALYTARQDGRVVTESQENLFITRWFAQAQKQRRFPRDVASDITWILNQGRTLGIRARLRNKLDYMWRSCTGELLAQNDLFRLTYAMELAREHDWVYHVLSDKDWLRLKPTPSVNSICLLNSALDIAFQDDGTQVTPLPVKIQGRKDGLGALLQTCGWKMSGHDDDLTLMSLSPVASGTAT